MHPSDVLEAYVTAWACMGSSFDMLRLYRRCKQASTPDVHEFTNTLHRPRKTFFNILDLQRSSTGDQRFSTPH